MDLDLNLDLDPRLAKLALTAVLLLTLSAFPSAANAYGIVKAEMKFYVEPVVDTYYAGDNLLKITIENGASVDEMPMQNSSSSDLLFLLTTAKNVRLELEDTSYVDVPDHALLLGDLPAGRPVTLSIPIKVSEITGVEEYIPVKITYDRFVLEIGEETTLKYEKDLVYKTNVEIKLDKKDYDVSAKVLNSVHAGEIEEVAVEIKNTGKDEIYNASALLNSTPPLIPRSFSSYIGNLKPGESRVARFKIYAPSSAIPQTYPAKLVITFTRLSGFGGAVVKNVGIRVVGERLVKAEVVKCYIPRAVDVMPSSSFQMPSSRQYQQYPTHLSLPSVPSASSQISPQITGSSQLPFRGFVALKITNEGEDMRDVRASLRIETPSLIVENTPYIGLLHSGESRVVVFYVSSRAPPGDYTGYLTLKYRNGMGDEVVSDAVYVRVNVSSIPPVTVRKVEMKNLLPGQVGQITVDVSGSIRNLKLHLIPSDILSPVSSSYFLPNGSGEASFRVKVDRSAVTGTHMLYLAAKFDTDYARDVTSILELPVLIKREIVQFEITGVSGELHPDSTGDIVVTVKNTGNETMRDAIMMLSVTQPLTIAGGSAIGSLIGQSQPGEYYIGDLKPGEVKKATFRVTVDKDAGSGEYPAEVRLKYYDESNYVHTSDSVVVPLRVTRSPPYLLAAAAVFALIGIAIAINFARKRRK